MFEVLKLAQQEESFKAIWSSREHISSAGQWCGLEANEQEITFQMVQQGIIGCSGLGSSSQRTQSRSNKGLFPTAMHQCIYHPFLSDESLYSNFLSPNLIVN